METYVSKEQYSIDIKKIKQNLDIIIALLNKFCKHSGDSRDSGVSAVSDNDYRQMINTLILYPDDYNDAIETFYTENKIQLNNKQIKGISVRNNNLRITKNIVSGAGMQGETSKEYYEDNEVYDILNSLLTDKNSMIYHKFIKFLSDNVIHSATTTTTPTQKGFFSRILSTRKIGGGKNNKKYKSTKNKVNVIINKKSFIKTIYKNSNNVNYIKINKEYKLLSKFKVLTA